MLNNNPLNVVVSTGRASGGSFVQLHVTLIHRVAIHLNILEVVAGGVG